MGKSGTYSRDPSHDSSDTIEARTCVWHELLQPHVHEASEEHLSHGDGHEEAGAEPEPAG